MITDKMHVISYKHLHPPSATASSYQPERLATTSNHSKVNATDGKNDVITHIFILIKKIRVKGAVSRHGITISLIYLLALNNSEIIRQTEANPSEHGQCHAQLAYVTAPHRV